MLDSAFRRTKLIMASVLVLTHLEPEAPVSLAVDPSDSHVVKLSFNFSKTWAEPGNPRESLYIKL